MKALLLLLLPTIYAFALEKGDPLYVGKRGTFVGYYDPTDSYWVIAGFGIIILIFLFNKYINTSYSNDADDTEPKTKPTDTKPETGNMFERLGDAVADKLDGPIDRLSKRVDQWADDRYPATPDYTEPEIKIRTQEEWVESMANRIKPTPTKPKTTYKSYPSAFAMQKDFKKREVKPNPKIPNAYYMSLEYPDLDLYLKNNPQ